MAESVVILGGGESGVGAAILAKKLGYEVFISDKGSITDTHKRTLLEYEIPFEELEHNYSRILEATRIIKSPGISEKYEVMKLIRSSGKEVISELEFAYQHTKSKIVAITGSNGKTTTTSLVHHILKHAGIDCGLGGNIGISFAKQVALNPKPVYVLEVSSFQLDDIKTFKPDISILTNITPDHLDRYDYKLENYAKAKFNITVNQDANDYFIYCSDDPLSEQFSFMKSNQVNLLPFGFNKIAENGAWIEDNNIIININNNNFIMSIQDLGLSGRHNVYNSMAAGIAARLFDVRKELVRESLSNFESLEHRLEKVAKVGGVEFINDSKATNVNSTWYALESITKPIIWIAGGVDKGNDYEVLKPLVEKKVKALVCLGVDNRPLHQAFNKTVDLLVNTQDMIEAVSAAYRLAKPGDIVLLSPACASFDLFENYEDRGKKFKSAVRNL